MLKIKVNSSPPWSGVFGDADRLKHLVQFVAREPVRDVPWLQRVHAAEGILPSAEHVVYVGVGIIVRPCKISSPCTTRAGT